MNTMTDLPAVVYLKAKSPPTEIDTTDREDTGCESENDDKTVKNNKRSSRSHKRVESYRKLLEALNSVILKKMDKIDRRLDILCDNSDILEEKVDTLSSYFESNIDSSCEASNHSTEAFHTVTENGPTAPIRSKVTHIVLNSERDYPEGSWLGFENNPEMRVRCKITPRNLQEINRKCVTPEKMALTLLDHLFDRETQACSNISGLGKHRKKQLDPLLIYGIRCHLMYRFDISEEEWTKIKIHIDSKCRTAFRRKLKGMPIRPRRIILAKTVAKSDYFGSASRDSNSSNLSSDQEMTPENISF